MPSPSCIHSIEYDGILLIVTWSLKIVNSSDWQIIWLLGKVITGACCKLTFTVSVATPQQYPESWTQVSWLIGYTVNCKVAKPWLTAGAAGINSGVNVLESLSVPKVGPSTIVHSYSLKFVTGSVTVPWTSITDPVSQIVTSGPASAVGGGIKVMFCVLVIVPKQGSKPSILKEIWMVPASKSCKLGVYVGVKLDVLLHVPVPPDQK